MAYAALQTVGSRGERAPYFPEVIPFEELTILFLDYLRSQEQAACTTKCLRIFKQLRLGISIIQVYLFPFTLCALACLIDQRRYFSNIALTGLVHSAIYCGLRIEIEKQRKNIGRKRTFTRKLILLGLLEQVQQLPNLNRIHLFKFDERIAGNLSLWGFVKELMRQHIALPFYLVASFMLMLVSATKYCFTIDLDAPNYLQLTTIALSAGPVYLIAGLSVVGGGAYLVGWFIMLLLKILVNMPFLFQYLVNICRQKQLFKSHFKQYELVDVKNTMPECSICLAPMSKAILLHCGHHFHKNCLVGWGRLNSTCPICREAI